MSVMVSKKSLDGGGWVETYSIFFGFLEFFLTLQGP